jgi:type IV pilus assembly protein PilM
MSTQIEAPGGFDPYRAWLDVLEVHRPLNAYQLLNLPVLEEDPDVIRSAAGRQRVALGTHRHEALPEVWEQVAAELEEAIGTLLDADKKNAYDTALEREIGLGLHATAGAITGKTAAGSVRCGGCGHQNAATRKFCADCGSNLWEPCYQCGTLSTSGEKFCGACGANLVGGLDKIAREFDENFRRAEAMREACEYDEAIALLGSMTRTEHSRLGDYVRRANRRISELAAERDRRKAEAQETLGRARLQIDEHHYQAAVDLLETIPLLLRGNDAEDALKEARSRLDEIGVLRRQIREAVAVRQVSNLLPQLDRLLALEPDNAEAAALAGKLQTRLCQAARERLARHEYDRALKLVEQVPETVSTEETRKLYEQTAELAWLSWDLRHAPYVDPPLVAVGRRLRKLAPRDAHVEKLHAELERRAKIVAENHRTTPLAWAAPPQGSPLGCPVEWITSLPSLQPREGAELDALGEHPGTFFVACGLALQGLGRAPVKINLLPPDTGGLVGRMGRMVRKLPSKSAWGIDLSSHALKAVRLVYQEKQHRVLIDACDYVEHRKPLGQALNDTQRRTLLEETFRIFRARNKVKADRVCAGLPGMLAVCRHLTLPPVEKSKIPSVVQYEAKIHLPYDLAELAWGYHLLDDTGEEHDVRHHEIALVAVRREQLRQHLERLSGLDVQVDEIVGDCLALHNALLYDRLACRRQEKEEAPDEGNVAILDMGAESTSVVVSSPRTVWFRNVGVGGMNLTRALVREFDLTLAQAEGLKADPTGARRVSRVYEALGPVFQDLMEETRSSLETFARLLPGQPVSKILCVGGGFRFHGLLRYLRTGR